MFIRQYRKILLFGFLFILSNIYKLKASKGRFLSKLVVCWNYEVKEI